MSPAETTKGFCKSDSCKTLYHRISPVQYLARLLTQGLKPFLLPSRFHSGLCRNDISPYSGGTVMEFHHIPFARYHALAFYYMIPTGVVNIFFTNPAP